jgi:hypothetical protein
MNFYNQVNGLVIKLLRSDFNEAKDSEMLVMERVYPVDFKAFELEKVSYGWRHLKKK